jgi:uncharacterized low-complexity protein
MADKKAVRPVALAVGAALAGSFALSGTASADTLTQGADNPFQMTALSAGYMLGGHKGGEGSCGEGSCGGDKDKEGEGSCGGDKEGEGSCGGDKEGEGSCGGDKDSEGKCGEGSCGGSV